MIWQYLMEIFRQKLRVLIVLVILLCLNIVLYVVLIVYQQPKIAALQNQWNDLRQQASKAGRQDIATLHKKAGDDLIKLRQRIPEKKEFARVLGDLLEAASGSAVDLSNITYKPSLNKDERLLTYQMTFSVAGRYAGLKSYLAELQKNHELLVVDLVSFSNKDSLSEQVVMDVALTIYLKEGA